MTKYTIKKIAAKLYRDSYQNYDGYHEVYYDAESDKLSLAFLQGNSWSQDRTGLITTMRGKITPSYAFEISYKILCLIEEEEFNLKTIRAEPIENGVV
jgi:hypothetical protein